MYHEWIRALSTQVHRWTVRIGEEREIEGGLIVSIVRLRMHSFCFCHSQSPFARGKKQSRKNAIRAIWLIVLYRTPTMLSRTCLTRTSLRVPSHRFVSSVSTVPLPKLTGPTPPHLLTLADLPISKIQALVSSAIAFKKHYKSNAIPLAGRTDSSEESPSLLEKIVTAPLSGIGSGGGGGEAAVPTLALKSLDHKTVALMFNKRSTRTRVASESAVHMLGACAASPSVALLD